MNHTGIPIGFQKSERQKPFSSMNHTGIPIGFQKSERQKPFSSMNHTGVPIGFQKADQTSLTFPASAGAIPASQSFPRTISPALSALSNNQSSYANDQSGEEVGDIIKPFSSMNHDWVPIGFQKADQTSLTFPASAGAIPASQSFPRTISPALSALSNNQSSYANDQSGEEVGDIIKPTKRNRKKPKFWTKEEHQNFLNGMELYGKGRWKIIAKQAVKTKTSTQVASHAQKHTNRQNLPPDKRKRSSIHDNTVADVISPQKKPRQLHVESPIGHPTPSSQQQPEHATALTTQPPAPVESQAGPSTSYAPAPVNDNQFDDLLYLPEWGWSSRFG